MPQRALGILVLLCGAGCVASAHSVAPYRDDVQAAAALEARAEAFCRDWHQGPIPGRPFRTDGCTLWPDSEWADCCVEHDIAYWCGGNADERRHVDRAFRACIREHPRGGFAYPMFLGVRVGGLGWVPVPWRWGFGWSWPAWDAPPCEEPPRR